MTVLAEMPERGRIAVFRALVLGDLLCAVPALRALRAAVPHAAITLVGLPWAHEFAARLACIDDFVAFPGWPGLPERECDLAALPGFIAQVQSRGFDLALQLQGSGGIVNPLVATFGAAHCAGFATPPAWRPEADAANFIDFPTRGHEIDRLLALTDHLEAPRRGRALEWPIVEADRATLHALWPGLEAGPFAIVHVGAQLPSRRWGAARFARVAEGLVARGLRVVVTGTPAERPLVDALAAALHGRAIDLAGRTSLWTLGALVERAALVVCNDTGISHVAAALGTPSVVISCGADVSRWAPLDAARHVVLAGNVSCRPCAFRECPYGHECAGAITPAQVLQSVDALQRQVAAVVAT